MKTILLCLLLAGCSTPVERIKTKDAIVWDVQSSSKFCMVGTTIGDCRVLK